MDVQRFDFREFTSSDVKVDAGKSLPSFRKASRAPEPPKQEAPPPPPEPVVPTFSEEDVRAAELKGYQRGFAEGVQDGKQQYDAQEAELQAQIHEHVASFITMAQPMFDHYRAMVMEMRGQLAPMALSIARKVAGPALDENAEKIIEETALNACENLFTEPKLTITVHESMGDMLAKQLEILTNKLQATTDIVILRDPDMPRSDCRVEWKNGVLERDTAKIWQQLEQAVDNISTTTERDTNQQLDALQAALPVQPQSPETSVTQHPTTEHKE